MTKQQEEMKMEKRIRESSHGGYIVEFGKAIEEQPNPCGIGYIMPGFMVYKSIRCDSLKKAEEEQYQ